MNDEANPIIKAILPHVWPIMAALAGGMVATSLPPYRGLTVTGKLWVIFVSLAVAVFMAPVFVDLVLPGYSGNSRLVAFMYFVFSISGMGIAPKIADLGLRIFGFADVIFKPKGDKAP